MALITDLPAASSLATTDLLIKDTGSATQKIAISDAYATASQPGLVSTGAQTFAGTKQFNNGLYVVSGLYITNDTANGISAPIYRFSDAPSANAEYGRIFLNYMNYGGQLKFRQYSGSSSARTSYREDYVLPVPDASRTSNANYNIITTKNLNDAGISKASFSGAKSITLSTSYRGILWITDSNASNCGEYIVSTTGAGAVTTATIKAASGITISTATNTLTLTPSSGTRTIMMLTASGTATY